MLERWRRGRDERAGRQAGPPLPGVIDTVGFGYAAVAAKPLTVLPLLLLELFLLFLPQLQLRPLTTYFAGLARDQGSDWNALADDVETFADYNALELSALRVPLMRFPALVPVVHEDEVRELAWVRTIESAPGWFVAAACALAIGAGAVIAGAYQLLAATAAGAPAASEALRVRAVLAMARDLGLWFVVLFGMLALVAMPMVVLTTLGIIFGFPEIAFFWILLGIPFAWGYIHFYFSLPALALDRGGAARSLRASYRVVRAGFWQALQMIALSLLISTGFTYALQAMATNVVGTLLAVLLNAFVGTGLLIAAMLFYRDRAARLGLTSSTPGR